MVKEGTVTGIDLDMDSKPEPCHQCIEAKATALAFQDVYSHETRVYFLHRKSDAFESYKIEEVNSRVPLSQNTSRKQVLFVI